MELIKSLENKPIIGVLGKARAGKDTIALYLEEKYNIIKVAFADDLKDKAMRDFGLSWEQVHGDLKEEPSSYPEYPPRKILQELGCFYRTIDKDYWPKRLFEKIRKEEIKTRDGICISDVRFLNEVNIIKKMNGHIIKVTRQSIEKINGADHISENELNDFEILQDDIITNDSSLEELYKKVDVFMARTYPEIIKEGTCLK
jgi:dephospho-CoA kinase